MKWRYDYTRFLGDVDLKHRSCFTESVEFFYF